jgi:hypothetical protein
MTTLATLIRTIAVSDVAAGTIGNIDDRAQLLHPTYLATQSMSPKYRPLLAVLLLIAIAGCSGKKTPKVTASPSPSPAISITKPINKAKDTKTSVEQLGKQREQMNPEAEPAKP